MKTSACKIVAVSLAVSSLYGFGCKKPEPERVCHEKTGQTVVCPAAIDRFKEGMGCVLPDKSLMGFRGKIDHPDRYGLSRIKVTEAKDSFDLFEVELETPAGLKGSAIAFRCQSPMEAMAPLWRY